METLNQQARRLSSGTIATLTKLRRYSDIDRVRAQFVTFCDILENPPKIWQDAWALFVASNGVERALQGE